MTKKLPMPDGQQDDARLVARARQAEDGVAQRKPAARARSAAPRSTTPVLDQVQHERDAGEPAADDRADLQRRGLPAGDRDQRGADDHRGADLRRGRAPPRARGCPPTSTTAGYTRRPGKPAGRPAAQQQQRLDPPDLEQRHQREQQRDQQADRRPLPHRRERQRSSVGRAERGADVARESRRAPAARARRPARCRPARGSTTCSTYADEHLAASSRRRTSGSRRC